MSHDEGPRNSPTHAPSTDGKRRSPAAIFSLAALAAVVFPVVENWRTPPRDDFPLSYYPGPVASQDLRVTDGPGATVSVTHFFDVDYSGVRNVIPYDLVAPGTFNQSHAQIQALATTKEGAETLCTHVAEQLIAKRPDDQQVVAVLIVRATYRLDPFYEGKVESALEQLLARCRIVRNAEEAEKVREANEKAAAAAAAGAKPEAVQPQGVQPQGVQPQGAQ